MTRNLLAALLLLYSFTSLSSEKLKTLRSYKLPIKEVSGICWYGKDRAEIAIVSDDNNIIHILDWKNIDKGISFTVIDLNKIGGSHYKGGWEAVASDDTGRLFLLQEHPSRIVVLNSSLSKVIHEISLEVTKDLEDELDWDKKNSGGEGITLLKNGNILVSKEKKPLRVVEFSPKRNFKNGYSPALSLEQIGTFPLSSKEKKISFYSTHFWKLDKKDKKNFKDVSSMNIDRNNEIYLLSDKSHAIAHIGNNLSAGNHEMIIKKLFELPSDFEKAEGMVIDSQGRAIITVDSRKTKNDNLFVTRLF